LKGLLKGFWWPFRLLKSVKYSWSYGLNEACDIERISSLYLVLNGWIGPMRLV